VYEVQVSFLNGIDQTEISYILYKLTVVAKAAKKLQKKLYKLRLISLMAKHAWQICKAKLFSTETFAAEIILAERMICLTASQSNYEGSFTEKGGGA